MRKEPEEKSPIINEKTLMPISFIIIILAGALRVESTSFKANANEKDIDSIKKENKEIYKNLSEVKESLARIEGALKIKKNDP